MKKLILMCGIIASTFTLGKAQDVQLPEPQKNGGKTLLESLNLRRSQRSFSEKELPLQELSNLLWAGNGINHASGKRTAPSAINAQDIELYVGTKDGVFYYDVKNNKLTKVSGEDLRPVVADHNKFVNNVPVVVLLVSNTTKFRGHKAAMTFAAIDAGNVAQNICLYCAAAGLSTVQCAPHIDADAVQKLLNVSADMIPIMYLPVGYSK